MTLVEKKTDLAKILQDNEKCKSCKILAEKANLARIWQKTHILQDSCKILERLASTRKISCKIYLTGRLNSAANLELSMAANIKHWNRYKAQNHQFLFGILNIAQKLFLNGSDSMLTGIASNCIGWTPNRKEKCSERKKETYFIGQQVYLLW